MGLPALAGPILALLLRLPVCTADRAEAGYVERQAVIATAIADVSSSQIEAAALVTIMRFESAGCRAVHAGERKGGPGEGLWQIEPGSHRQRPFSGVSFEATRHAAGEALWLWRHSRQCGQSWQARFTAYAGVPHCGIWTDARRRSIMLGWINHQLNQSHRQTSAAQSVSRTKVSTAPSTLPATTPHQ